MEKEMEKENNFGVENENLKQSFLMGKEMGKEKNIIMRIK